MSEQKLSLVAQAKQILDKNWRDGFTVPNPKLYPFQWNWDAGFTCLGHGAYRPERVLQEMDSLFSGQWANGMVPHIIFHSEKETTYFPNHDFWATAGNSGAPQRPKTSGITQPPVHGFILARLLAGNTGDEDLVRFARKLFPKIVAAHRFFYQYRDPEREGLAFIYHPWETGRDNSPLWDEALNRIDLTSAKLPAYTRKDTELSDAAHRPTSDQYDRFVYLLELGKRHAYDGPGIYAESPVLIQDTLINAVLIYANECLIRIGKQLDLDVGELREWQQAAVPAFRAKLWNEKLQVFTGFDLRAGQQIEHREIGGMTGLLGDLATTKQQQALNDYLLELHEREYYLCPSFDPDSPLFDSQRYWRGPIWPQMNWLIHTGLLENGFPETAKIVRDDLLEIVGQVGFYEYFEARKVVAAKLQKGYGAGDFSWTAACVLDFIA